MNLVFVLFGFAMLTSAFIIYWLGASKKKLLSQLKVVEERVVALGGEFRSSELGNKNAFLEYGKTQDSHMTATDRRFQDLNGQLRSLRRRMANAERRRNVFLTEKV